MGGSPTFYLLPTPPPRQDRLLCTELLMLHFSSQNQ